MVTLTGIRSVAATIRENVCALRGHSLVLGFEPQRIFLRCGNCGYETRGWELDAPRYRHPDDGSGTDALHPSHDMALRCKLLRYAR
jgi:hypothetical protein